MTALRVLLLAATIATPGFAAAAATSYSVSFAEPAASAPFVSSERQWSCAGVDCRAGGEATSPAKHICARLAKEVGLVTAFSAKGREFSAEEIARCNERAGRGGSVAASK